MADDRENHGNEGGFNAAGNNRLAACFDASARPIVTVDVAKYQAYLDDSGLSDAQKEEVLKALWSIVVTFIDLGFGVHPLQEVCGQNEEIGIQGPKQAFDSVESKNTDNAKLTMDSEPPGTLEVE